MKIKNESGFCAPIAIKFLTGLADKKVLQVCGANGFRQEWGMEDYEVLKCLSILGIRYRRVRLKVKKLYAARLSKIAKEFPVGTYLIYTSNHILVIKNGVIIDPINEGYLGEDRAVTAAWRIFP